MYLRFLSSHDASDEELVPLLQNALRVPTKLAGAMRERNVFLMSPQ
jgi:hypothetical protein